MAELKNLGTKGRKHLVDVWGAYLPKYGDPPFQSSNLNNGHSNQDSASQHEDDLDDDLDEEEGDEDQIKHRRNQSTAVILLGVIGALFDLEADKKGEADLALGTHLTRLTAKALMFLVLTTSTSRAQSVTAQMTQNSNVSSAESTSVNTPTSTASTATLKITPTAKTALRRAAIDLIGRGFVLWEPHLEVSKVLLGLLEMCCEADWWVPSSKYGLPLTAAGDSCRTSRYKFKFPAKYEF